MDSHIILFGTWKNKLSPSKSVKLAKTIKNYIKAHPLPFELSICPSMVSLQAVALEIAGSIPITAQNVIWDAPLSFTGETSADSLVEIGCKYVMIGHSERRMYLAETDEQISKKVLTAIKNGLIPLICIGEFYEDYKQGRTNEVIDAQMKAIIPSLKNCESPSQFLIAYEPAWAITTSQQAIPCDPSLAEQRHKYIRKILRSNWTADFADNVKLIYGAGVNKENIDEFLSQPNIGGGLAGGASQSAEKFIELIEITRGVIEKQKD